MRVTTGMVYGQGKLSMQQQSERLLHLSEQIYSGRRILTPADDPIAAARVLEISQSSAVNSQFGVNGAYANDNLKLLEARFNGMTDLFHYVRERAVQANDGNVLNDRDLDSLAADMRAQFDALLSLANSQDGNGDYLFAGYKSNTRPFTGNVAGITYNGDQGIRSIQVSEQRSMPISLPGSELFQNTRNLSDALYTEAGRSNQGTGAVSLAYNPNPPVLADTGRRYEIRYDASVVAPANPYTVLEYVPGNPNPVTTTTTFVPDVTPGAAPGAGVLSFNGLDATVSGAPANGDAFDVLVASKDVFQNFALFIDGLERPGASRMAATVAATLDSLDGALGKLLSVHADVGSHMEELESLKNTGADLNLQYERRMSDLQDVDYYEALSDFARVKLSLDSAQAAYMQIINLSLFNYLR